VPDERLEDLVDNLSSLAYSPLPAGKTSPRE